MTKVVPISGLKSLEEIYDDLEEELRVREICHIIQQPQIAGYWDSPWGVSISGLTKPTRWQRYWHKKLLGWTWRDSP